MKRRPWTHVPSPQKARRRKPMAGSKRLIMLEALRSGEKTSVELCDVVGFAHNYGAGVLRALERKGLIECLSKPNQKPLRWRLATAVRGL